MNIYRISLLSIGLLAMASLQAMQALPKLSVALGRIKNETDKNIAVKIYLGSKTTGPIKPGNFGVLKMAGRGGILQETDPIINLLRLPQPGNTEYYGGTIEVVDEYNNTIGSFKLAFTVLPTNEFNFTIVMKDLGNGTEESYTGILPYQPEAKEIGFRINLIIKDPISESILDYGVVE